MVTASFYGANILENIYMYLYIHLPSFSRFTFRLASFWIFSSLTSWEDHQGGNKGNFFIPSKW